MGRHHVIILTEPAQYSEEAKKILGTCGNVFEWGRARNNQAVLGQATILVVKLGMQISKEVMRSLPNLKIIATSTTGLNHIDMEEAKRRGVAVLSLRGERRFLKTIFPTAEETIGLMIMLMRRLPWGFDAVRKGQWTKEDCYGYELFGKTLGIVGFGRLGSMVASFAQAFGMEVLGSDPHVAREIMERKGAKKVSLETLCKKADVVSMHVLLGRSTHRMFGRRHFQLMKPTAYFINTARGELVDERFLLEALKKKWIAGAALDVLANEDPQGRHLKRHPLVEYARIHDDCIVVPHLGGATYESMARTEEFIAKKVKSFVRRLKP